MIPRAYRGAAAAAPSHAAAGAARRDGAKRGGSRRLLAPRCDAAADAVALLGGQEVARFSVFTQTRSPGRYVGDPLRALEAAGGDGVEECL